MTDRSVNKLVEPINLAGLSLLYYAVLGPSSQFFDYAFSQVQTLEEMIRRLQEDNTQIRSQNQKEMQIEIQRQVEHQVLEHMRQRELEANAREQARERENGNKE
ncbi:hypothetical protein Tco_0230971 [Tanacetum coccineum]